ncbi:MAG: PSD1 and planctomycete cytochrome C domain-containing protein [Verrucomicrobia subdivision 3 bacterium]|nr:PSD1 and planctomycete cytochrome C domain-containing protein [Limisphaerales bacterium]
MRRLAILGLIAAFHADAAEPARAQLDFFENKVRPLLAKHCYKCHSHTAEKVKGGLLLDTRDGVLAGGNSGPVIVPGNPDKSLLIQAVRYGNPDLQMPPKGAKLTDAEIADLAAWVKMGAPDPRVATAAQKEWVDSGKKHWAFQPVKKPSVPTVKDAKWAQSDIDKFILAKLEATGLKPNPPADKRTLIRRASFDLIGLPPSPEEVQAFLDDNSSTAFERVVQRLLNSPHYGERWGRHWLDTARYSDTKGEIRRQREDPNYPYAWTYRDYVIRSFNDDKPCNIFIIEQLAADKLPATASDPSKLAALGFLTIGDRFMGMQHDIINDRIDVVTKGFLGLTVTCARCHDHKFDPIPTKDYYSLHGIFASCREPEVEPIISKIPNTPEYQDYYRQRAALNNEKQELEARFRELRRKRDREGLRQLQREMRENSAKVARLEMTHEGAPTRAMAIEDAPKPRNSPVFIRGEAENRGQVVPRRFLEALSGPARPEFTNGSGRLQLAHAIADKKNPLTARVMVNRVWLHHFGEGFVSTPDDLGTQAESPSHPELLDFLAGEFIQNGWSLKKLHKQIMLTSVYQQSSANNPQYAQIDPNNRLLWRANIRRLEFEPLRDSLLAIGGTLDRTQFGRPVDLRKEPYSTRRSIYGFIDRNNVAEVLFSFDFANPDMTTGKRHQTTVPQQALFFMNSPLVVEQARKLVERSDFTALKNDVERIQLLYEIIYQRPARAGEVKLGLEFVAQEPSHERVIPVANNRRPAREAMREEFRARIRDRRAGEAPFRSREPLTAWQEYAHALLQANETSFVN